MRGIDMHCLHILSVSKITYPLGSLGNNKETQQAPEPSSSDYIIVTCWHGGVRLIWDTQYITYIVCGSEINLMYFLKNLHILIFDKIMFILWPQANFTRYKIQDVYLGISSYPGWVVYRKMPEQVLLKSIKVCKYK